MNKGFTLIEVLLSIALLGLLVAFSLPVFFSFQTKNDFDIAGHTTIRTLRRAEFLAQSNERDSGWGVKIENSGITLFKGSSYVGRDTSFDEVTSFSSSRIGVTGASEIVFSKMTGVPSAVSTTTLSTDTGETMNIIVNAKGIIN